MWGYQVAPAPILVALLLAESPMWLRRVTGFYYAPVYTTFLFESMNDDLTVYFGEDIVGRGSALDVDGAEAIRRRIRFAAFGSGFLSALVVPAWAGVVCAVVLGASGLTQFMIAYGAYRVWRCVLSYDGFSTHAIATDAARKALVLVYVLYTGVAIEVMKRAFDWAMPFVAEENITGLLGSIAGFFFGDLMVMALIVGAASTFFSNVTADPNIRLSQIKNLQERAHELKRLRFAPPFDPALGASTSPDPASPSGGVGGDSGGVIPSK